MKVFRFILCCIILSPVHAFAQQYSEAIEDNSYFIEEAFNQDAGVVQHISNGYYALKAKDFIFTFTQEWPAWSEKHQLSYTLPYQSLGGKVNGPGDIMLNYRYQLLGEDDPFWCSPRLTLIVPTGDQNKGLGIGKSGVQVSIPISKRVNKSIYAHFNAGATFTSDVSSYFIGGSGILLLRENFNLMLELLYNNIGEPDQTGSMERISETILSPGFRYAFNAGNVQIVPGVAFPIVFGSGTAELGLFGYLSFEHPF